MTQSTKFSCKDDADEATIVTKDGREVPFTWLTNKWRTDAKHRRLWYRAIYTDYTKFLSDGMKPAEAVEAVIEKRELHDEFRNPHQVVRNALARHTDTLDPKTRSIVEGRLLVLADREVESLLEEIDEIDAVLEMVRSKPEQDYWETEVIEEKGGRQVTKTKKLPSVEYVLALMERKGKMIRQHADTIRSYIGQKSDTNVNVGVTVNNEKMENRVKGVKDRFGVRVEEN